MLVYRGSLLCKMFALCYSNGGEALPPQQRNLEVTPPRITTSIMADEKSAFHIVARRHFDYARHSKLHLTSGSTLSIQSL